MVDYLAPYKLSKEARESWDYFITDELVYGVQDIDAVDRGRSEGYLKAYTNRHMWGEMFWKYMLPEVNYCCIVEAEPDTAEGRNGGVPNPTWLDDEPVISLVGQLTQHS